MADAVRVKLTAAEVAKPRSRAMSITSWYHRLDVPYAPQETEHSGFARVSEVRERPGRKALLRMGGPGLRVESFSLIIGYPDHRKSIEPVLNTLKEMAKWGDLTTLSYGPMEGGIWRMTELSINITMRNYPLGEATRAQASMTWTEASDAVLAVSPLTGGAKPSTPKPKTSTSTATPTGVGTGTTTYTVRKGDTLSGIAGRMLGDPTRYTEIAKLNGIRNANLIYPGQILKIPRR